MSRTGRPLTKRNCARPLPRLKVGRPAKPASRTPSRAASIGDRVRAEVRAHHLRRAGSRRASAPVAAGRSSGVRSLPESVKRISGMGHGEALDDVGDRRRLGPLRLQELEPRRRREEEVAHLDPRAREERRRPERRRRRPPSTAISKASAAPPGARRATAAPPRRSPPAPRRGSRASGCRRVRRRASRCSGARPRARGRRGAMPPPSSLTRISADAARGRDDLDPAARRRRSRSRPAP